MREQIQASSRSLLNRCPQDSASLSHTEPELAATWLLGSCWASQAAIRNKESVPSSSSFCFVIAKWSQPGWPISEKRRGKQSWKHVQPSVPLPQRKSLGHTSPPFSVLAQVRIPMRKTWNSSWFQHSTKGGRGCLSMGVWNWDISGKHQAFTIFLQMGWTRTPSTLQCSKASAKGIDQRYYQVSLLFAMEQHPCNNLGCKTGNITEVCKLMGGEKTGNRVDYSRCHMEPVRVSFKTNMTLHQQVTCASQEIPWYERSWRMEVYLKNIISTCPVFTL